MLTKLSIFRSILLIFQKEIMLEWRSPQTIGTMLMFSLTTLSVISMILGPQQISPEILAGLLWIILFFSAVAGLSNIFQQEQQTGTIYGLRIYGDAQSVLFGKFTYVLFLLTILMLFILPFFCFFFNTVIYNWQLLLITLLLGAIGMAVLMTMLAGLLLPAHSQNALFFIISFPILLPLLLSCIMLTIQSLNPQGNAGSSQLLFLLSYDLAMLGISSILFDYIW